MLVLYLRQKLFKYKKKMFFWTYHKNQRNANHVSQLDGSGLCWLVPCSYITLLCWENCSPLKFRSVVFMQLAPGLHTSNQLQLLSADDNRGAYVSPSRYTHPHKHTHRTGHGTPPTPTPCFIQPQSSAINMIIFGVVSDGGRGIMR